MKCPIDGTDLQMTERRGVEIDYCPKCRGIWLDRGELDKLIEKSLLPDHPADGAAGLGYPYGKHGRYDDRGHKKRKSILREIFDF